MLRGAQAQRVVDNIPQITEVQRFGNEVEGTELERLHSRFDVAMGSNNGYRDAGRVDLHPFDKFQAVTVGQPHIRETDIELVFAQQCLGAGDIDGRLGTDIHAFQRQRQKFTDIGFIVDYQR